MLRSRKQRDRKRARLAPAGLLLSFSGAYSTADPSAFEMPDTPANEAGVFYFRGRFAGSPLLADFVAEVGDDRCVAPGANLFK
jgi:hypothetical protein